MKLVDNRGKLFGLINLFDLFVIIVIVVLLSGVYIKFIKPQDEVKTAEIEYELEIVQPLKSIHAEALSEQDNIYFKKSDYMIGSIKNIKFEQASEYITNVNGDINWSDMPGYYKVTLLVSSTGYKEGRGYTINEIWNANVGATITFSTRKITAMGTVKSLKVLED